MDRELSDLCLQFEVDPALLARGGVARNRVVEAFDVIEDIHSGLLQTGLRWVAERYIRSITAGSVSRTPRRTTKVSCMTAAVSVASRTGARVATYCSGVNCDESERAKMVRMGSRF